MKEREVRQNIIHTGIALLDKGLVAGTWGNISMRTGEQVAITPSGRSYRTLAADDIVIVDLAGQVIDGTLKPSSELPLHLAIYRQRSDVQAIVHTHSVFASACAVAHQPIPPIIEDLVQLAGGAIDVAAYALPGTDELAQKAVSALADKFAVLLANHGVIGCGKSLQEAMLACELVEKAAQIFIYAQSLGGAKQLSNEDVALMHQFYLEHYRQRQGGSV